MEKHAQAALTPASDSLPQPIHGPLSPVRAFVVLLAIIAALAGYLTICYLLAIKPTYAGILLVFYWFAVKGGALDALKDALIGALGGVGNAALLTLPGLDAGVSALLGLLVVAIALYCLIAGFFPLLFNQAYMLLLTVAAIPSVLAERQAAGMAASIVLSAAYFGGLIWFSRSLIQRRARRVGVASAKADR